MNKLAGVATDDLLDQAVSKAAHEANLSNAEKMFLKERVEKEIRFKLAQFAKEISHARKQRSDM